MPRALLLSPDDQAVSAITGVLEEMSVTCERPLDGASAAQKLNSHSFDLVLVDCENLPAAKLIFDVCRRGNNGNNPVPIAIVDGRAGLPTAFRLGAELILTKPVAKDQARTTIRTAVSRVRKDVSANETTPEQPANPAMPSAVMPSAVKTEEHARAAAAASSQLTSFADPAPVAAPTAGPVVAQTSGPTATLSAPPLTTKMRSAIDEDEDEIDATPTVPKLDPPPTPSLAPSPSLPKSPSASAVVADSKPARPAKPSDDPVLAELEESELKSSRPDKAVSNQHTSESAAPVFSSYQQPQQKKRGPLAALLVLVLAGAAFYAAWMYQPGFRALAQPQIDRVLALVGIASPRQSPPPAPHPAKPSVQPVATTSSAPASESAADPNQRQSSGPASAAASTATAAATPVQPVAAPRTEVATPTSAAATTPAPVVGKSEAGKPADSKKDAAAAPLSAAAQLPGENSVIILSSKGAERRLAHSVQPNFPVEARGQAQAQGTVVLKEVVDQNGKVESVRLVEGNSTLATAAIQAVKQWRYRPYVRDGKAQPFQTIVIVDFQRP
jgi:periplasmic protein TonB